MAPEVLADQGYDGRKADVWSAGVILYVLLAGFLPFDESTMAALFRKIQNADYSYPSWFSADVRSLLDQVLVADPARRLTLMEVKHDPWFVAGGYEEPAPPTPVEDVAEGATDGDDGIEPTPEQVCNRLIRPKKCAVFTRMMCAIIVIRWRVRCKKGQRKSAVERLTRRQNPPQDQSD